MSSMHQYNRGQRRTREQAQVLLTLAKSECGGGRDPVAWLKSHVFTCSGGHLYVIGECGSPQVSANCPECGAAVGGRDHLLGPGNSLAVHLVQQLLEAGAD
ncbi:hypothetical protein HYH02_003911 [Chlamydomonas schloesseri]|uniref:RZ-type domain-containing protein n=1 Tax=Chlamydomonas schloesseri TaxID=2026947 RepID=A0A835WRI1_9CHLO|nr:hypothetical protein HYH02_003911 [Chlamydomonas schloesseri]|eukprot:KAG2451305.1 hypothetical protein HYH02_003911 [Chlamydomonas schloesseri]